MILGWNLSILLVYQHGWLGFDYDKSLILFTIEPNTSKLISQQLKEAG